MKNNNQSGLIMVGIMLGIGMFALGVAVLVVSATTSSLVKNSNSRAGNISFITAESVLREGTYQFIHDISGYTSGTFETINNTDGNSISVQPTGTYEYRVLGMARNIKTQREIAYTVNTFPSAFVFDHAVYSQNTIDLSGSTHIQGSIFANDDINVNNSGEMVDGDVYSATDIYTSNDTNISGILYNNVSTILPPTIDINVYYGTADLIFDETETPHISGTTEASPEIRYAEGLSNTTQFNNGTHYGTLIFEGDLNLTGGTFRSDSSDPLAIYVTGDLTLSGNPNIYGIIFVQGVTTIGNGNPEIFGSLISANGLNGVDLSGNLTIEYDPTLETSWENISGLQANSGSTPQITSWVE